jgi:hypothetical protein
MQTVTGPLPVEGGLFIGKKITFAHPKKPFFSKKALQQNVHAKR